MTLSKALPVFLLAALLGAGAVLLLPEEARADANTTLLTAGSSVTSMEFFPQSDGRVEAKVCGQAPVQGSPGTFEFDCYRVTLPAANAIAVAVTSLANNTSTTAGALGYYRQRRGLVP